MGLETEGKRGMRGGGGGGHTLLDRDVFDETRDDRARLSLSDVNLLDVHGVSVRVEHDWNERRKTSAREARDHPERDGASEIRTLDNLAHAEIDHPRCRRLNDRNHDGLLLSCRLLLLGLLGRSSLGPHRVLLALLRLLNRDGRGLSGSRGSGRSVLGFLDLDLGLDDHDGDVGGIDGDDGLEDG